MATRLQLTANSSRQKRAEIEEEEKKE